MPAAVGSWLLHTASGRALALVLLPSTLVVCAGVTATFRTNFAFVFSPCPSPHPCPRPARCVQVSLRLFGVPEAAAAAVCTFPDMKASLAGGWAMAVTAAICIPRLQRV